MRERGLRPSWKNESQTGKTVELRRAGPRSESECGGLGRLALFGFPTIQNNPEKPSDHSKKGGNR